VARAEVERLFLGDPKGDDEDEEAEGDGSGEEDECVEAYLCER
jgi:hypothetical protein